MPLHPGAFLWRATSCRHHPPGRGAQSGLEPHRTVSFLKRKWVALCRSPVPCTTRTISALLTVFPGPFSGEENADRTTVSSIIIRSSWDSFSHTKLTSLPQPSALDHQASSLIGATVQSQPQDIKPENLVFVSKARSKQLQRKLLVSRARHGQTQNLKLPFAEI